jgi:16S rRNA (cytosine1402-N4)-methyltransferase
LASDGERRHAPVLLAEALELLAVRPGGCWVDGTLGAAGHARALLERSAPGGRLLALDRDAESLAAAAAGLADPARVEPLHADFRELPELLDARQLRPDGVLLDLGVSSLQLDDPERGFSFRSEGPLDMRLDRSRGETAAELVAGLPEGELADLIYQYGEERASRRVARAIVRARDQAPIETTTRLAELVRRVVRRGRRKGLDPATRTFQALRIAVNRELEGLADAFRAIAARLAPGGRLAVIAFHSLEDREVKHCFRELSRGGFELLTKKPLRPGEAEREANPRSRSARLRGLRRPEEAA